jgi:hypothetical protein
MGNSAFLQNSPQPRMLAVHHEGTEYYQESTRHYREKQPNHADENKSPPQTKGGHVLDWFLVLHDFHLLDDGSISPQKGGTARVLALLVRIRCEVTGDYPGDGVSGDAYLATRSAEYVGYQVTLKFDDRDLHHAGTKKIAGAAAPLVRFSVLRRRRFAEFNASVKSVFLGSDK